MLDLHPETLDDLKNRSGLQDQTIIAPGIEDVRPHDINRLGPKY